MDPGGPDLGQPTNFFPRRNRFAFQVHVPKDFGTKEIVWTLTSKGRTEKAYGTLKPDYVLDDTSIMSNIGTGGGLSTTPDMVGNKAPALDGRRTEEPHGEGRRAGRRSPRSRPTMGSRTGRTCRRCSAATTSLPASANGLRLSFFVYRGPGTAVTFDPPQTEVWEDTRDGGSSPWSAGFKTPPIPDGNKWQAARDVRRARHLRRSARSRTTADSGHRRT